MTSPLILTQEQARAMLVKSQFLGKERRSASPEEVVRRLVAVQTQYAVSLPVALAARSSFAPGYIDAALNVSPSLYKSWTLRSTLHVHHVADRALLHEAVARHRYRKYLGWMTDGRGLTEAELAKREDRILNALAAGPLTRSEIHKKVPELKTLEYAGWGADVMGLAFRGLIVLAPSEPGPTRFALASNWLGELYAVEDSRPELFRRYLLSHAPATVADFAYWAGIQISEARRAFEQIKSELVPVEVEGLAGTLYILQEQEAPAEPAKGVRLLAKFDPLMMGHRDKTLFLPGKLKAQVFRKAGQVEATVLKDGRIVGGWRLVRGAKRCKLVVEPFARIGKGTMKEIAREARTLVRALEIETVSVELGDVPRKGLEPSPPCED